MGKSVECWDVNMGIIGSVWILGWKRGLIAVRRVGIKVSRSKGGALIVGRYELWRELVPKADMIIAVEKTTRTSTVPPPTDTESALAASGLTNPLVAPTGPLTLAPERDQGAGPAMTSTTLGSASGASGFQAESLPSLSPPIPVSSVPAGDSGFNEGWVGGMPMSGSRSGSGNRDRTSNEDLD